MAKHVSIMTPEGMAWSLIALLERSDPEGRRVAEEQILALCQFYEDHKDLDKPTARQAELDDPKEEQA